MKNYIFLISFILAFALITNRACAGDISNANDGFHINSYLKAAAHLESLPRDQAIAILQKMAESDQSGYLFSLYRMLFTASNGEKLRDPGIGGPLGVIGITHGFLNKDQSAKVLTPIILVNNIPFSVIKGWYFAGSGPETSSEYLNFCITHGEFGKIKFHVATREEMETALDKFRSQVAEIPIPLDEMLLLHRQMQPGRDFIFPN